MSLKDRRLALIRAAADRMGLTLRPDAQPTPCFDETHLLKPWPVREHRTIRDLPIDDAERIDQLQRAKVWLVEDQARVGLDEIAEAAACGCRIAVQKPFGIDILDGATTVCETDQDVINLLDLPATERVRSWQKRKIKGLGFYGAPFVEELRRWMVGRYSSAIAAIEGSTFDIARFEDHQKKFPRSNDAYMWHFERLIFAALVSNLPQAVSGAVVEIGVGSGGTYSVLVAFAPEWRNRLYAYDDSSYSGELQWTEFNETMKPLEDRKFQIMRHNSRHAGLREPIALLHVDGDHSFEGCKYDLEYFATQISTGGILVVDDFATIGDQAGVYNATQEFIAKGGWSPITAGPKIGVWRKTL